jgi:dienelactone hydrolase
MGDPLPGYDHDPFRDGEIEHDVRRSGAGPAVLVIHELPGIDEATRMVAERIRDEGFTVVLPDLLPPMRGEPSGLDLALNFGRICVSNEFWAFALRYDRPVTRWLQALARREHERSGGPGIGIVGMCLSGGFALAAATRAPISVAIAAEPSLPFRWRPGAARDLGMSTAEVRTLRDRAARGEVCVRAFRFEGDPVSPPERLARIKELLGGDAVVEPIPGRDHPVLDRAVGMTRHGPGAPDPNAVPALTETLRVLRETLLQAAPI